MQRIFGSDTEVRQLVGAFEAAALAPAEFGHAEHLAVASVFVLERPLEEAIDRMRAGLRVQLARHGRGGAYHETLTIFWIRLIAAHLATGDPAQPLHARINELVAGHGDRRLVHAHYSRELLGTAEAREGWVEPDLLPLDSHHHLSS